MRKLSFSKKMRLLNSDDFNNVFKCSKKYEISEIIILYRSNQLNYPRLGIIVSKKVSKYSHQRNLFKRLIRESFRLIQYRLMYFDFVIIVKPNMLILQKNKIQILLKHLWMRYYI
ncbi:ribonuclease P protein component [Buchnera aphidicola]|uniref:ribonuclease P protein component n=1 Tax=Buchnera aphidicola TaxID=9 RepID=UPI0034644237